MYKKSFFFLVLIKLSLEKLKMLNFRLCKFSLKGTIFLHNFLKCIFLWSDFLQCIFWGSNFSEKYFEMYFFEGEFFKFYYYFFEMYFQREHQQAKNKGRGASIRYLPPIVGGRGHTPLFLDQPPFSKISPFLEIQDVLTFHRSIRKTKALNNSCNQFVYHFYPQSILIFEECFKKWWNANLI